MNKALPRDVLELLAIMEHDSNYEAKISNSK